MTRRAEGFGAGLEGALESRACGDFVQVAAAAPASARLSVLSLISAESCCLC